MSSVRTRLAVTTAAAGALVAVAAGTAYAAGVSPANTAVTASSSRVQISAVVNGLTFTATCTSSTIKFTTPSSGYGPVPISPSPTFSGCTDNFGGSVTIKTSGTWTLTAVASPTGIKVSIPTGGAVITGSTLPGCTLTAAASTITGSYSNTTGQATFSNAPINFTSSGCGFTQSPAHMNGVYTTSPLVTIT